MSQFQLLNTIIRDSPFTKQQIFGRDQTESIADNKLEVDRMIVFLFDIAENIVGKGENAGHQHFLLFPQCFPKPSCLGSLKVRIMW